MTKIQKTVLIPEALLEKIEEYRIKHNTECNDDINFSVTCCDLMKIGMEKI